VTNMIQHVLIIVTDMLKRKLELVCN